MLADKSMKYALTFTLWPALWLAAPSSAAQGGTIRTMPQGHYECALPGDASTKAWLPVEGAHFVIDNASSYQTQDGRGTYLLTGRELVFTRGPLKGQRYRRVSDNALRVIEKGETLGRMRCIRTTR
jgi:hypothetical protein